MIISIASGKGGTGKTTIAVNLALSIDNVQLIDCDVEEPNAHLFLKPQIISRRISACIPLPEINEKRCNYCGKCREVCAYNAIAVIPGSDGRQGSVIVFPHLCHGCGACAILCPEKAIKEVSRQIGLIEFGEKDNMRFVNGRLNIGEVVSPDVIRQVKRYADKKRVVIMDAPPGTSCPVIAAVRGSDYTILVTEPTPFGLNDLILAVEVLRKLNIPFGVVINRSNIGDDAVEIFCNKEKIPILMKLPFSKKIAIAYSSGIPIVEADPSYRKRFQELYKKICAVTDETDSNN